GRCFVAEQTSLGPRLRGDDGSTGGRKRLPVAQAGGRRRSKKPATPVPASVERNSKQPVTPVPASVQRSSKHSVAPAQAGRHGRGAADGRGFIAEQTSLGPRLRGDDGSKTGRGFRCHREPPAVASGTASSTRTAWPGRSRAAASS